MSQTETIIDPATGQRCQEGVAENRVRKIFGSIAEKYELFNLVSSFGIYRSWLKKTIQAAPLTSTSAMLDLAGGTGDVSWTACRLKPPASIMLTDLTPAMLDVAKQHIAEGKNQGVDVTLEVVDAQSIPYQDESFDVVTMAYGIRNIPDRMRCLKEVHRVLKPGGTFVCLEFSTPTNPLWRSVYGAYRSVMVPFWGWVMTGRKDDFKYLCASIEAFPKQKEFGQMLSDAGFSQVAWENCTGGIAAIHTAVK